MLFGAYRFLSEVAVENLLHQRSILAIAVQQNREEGGTRRKKLGEELKKERAEPGEDEKDWGLTKRKLKQRRGSGVGGTTLPHRRLPLRAADSRNRRRRRRERETGKERTDRQETGRHLRLYLDPVAAPAPTALPYGEHLAVHH
jgi:hypothetical protein